MDNAYPEFVSVTPPNVPVEFHEVDARYFHGTFWPTHGRGLDVLSSNFHRKKGRPLERPIFIVWGRKAEGEMPADIVAIAIADEASERFWIAPTPSP